MPRYYHNPRLPGNWRFQSPETLRCLDCHGLVDDHLPEHPPVGNEYHCQKCGAPNFKHRHRRGDYLIGVDGEGQTLTGKHIYTLLAWSDAKGRNFDTIASPTGLRTKECLDFLLNIPSRARPFAYAFNYDLTMILRDVSDRELFLLFRPELRSVKGRSKPVEWEGYKLNLIGTRFTIARGKRKTVIWDTFRFYQASFVKALQTWKVGEAEVVERIQQMKLKRQDFDKLSTDTVEKYCLDECRHMAMLTDKLIDSHAKADLPLKSFYGAGSTASVMLKRWGIDEEHRDVPPRMKHAVACAFFGGRFENRVAGRVEKHVYARDISSAYPYQCYQLPDLASGKWRKTYNRKHLETCVTAVVSYHINPKRGEACEYWGPLPFRTEEGCIVFPQRGGGGWCWLQEFLVAEKHWAGVNFESAWVYESDKVRYPFRDIARAYVERLKLGKEGPGIVIKLGSNSVYGKMAQSVGRNRPFRSLAWAGMVTSGCRAQLLADIAAHKDRSNCLMVATDGVFGLENIKSAQPIETGTRVPVWNEKKQANEYKPLGGWEHKEYPNGIFAARPGIYFPLQPRESDMDAFRARGIGRKELYEQFANIMDGHASGSVIKNGRNMTPGVKVGQVTRFHGAKSSIHVGRDDEGTPCFIRSENYGQWAPRPINISFSPLPKRAEELPDGSLTLRSFPQAARSKPYTKGIVSPDALPLKIAEAIALEQPQ